MARVPPDEKWIAVDNHIAGNLIPADPALDAAMEANTAAGLPAIDVTPLQGKVLHLFARMVNARRILEIGTLGGYSTIWLARALQPDGRLVTLELEQKHAKIAKANLERAGAASQVEIRLGPALDSLAKLADESPQPFDLIFIDADKENNANYLQWALRFSRLGTLIVVDNVVRDGAIVNPDDPDPMIQGSRRLFEALAAEPRLTATALQTVSGKGYDGFALALVTS